jgi:hypothetical protein
MILSVEPEPTPVLKGYQEEIAIQCLNQTIFRLFYNTHLFESCAPREKKEKNKSRKKKEEMCSGYHHYSLTAPSGGP